MSGEHQALLITWQIPSLQWSMVVAASCYGGAFQWQGRGKDECSQIQEKSLKEKPAIFAKPANLLIIFQICFHFVMMNYWVYIVGKIAILSI